MIVIRWRFDVKVAAGLSGTSLCKSRFTQEARVALHSNGFVVYAVWHVSRFYI